MRKAVRKILQFIGSRFFIGTVCIFAEAALLLAVFIWVYEAFLPVTVLAWIFHFSVMLFLINRDEIPEFKLPWLMILLIIPVIGALVYVVLSGITSDKNISAYYKSVAADLGPYLSQTEILDNLKKENEDAWLQANYLCRAAKMPCLSNSGVTFFPSGEAFYEDFLGELKAARHFIFMEFFIVKEGKMWNPVHEILKEKVNAGVEVYFMYDDLGCIATLPLHYYKLLSAEGIHCVISNRFSPVLSRIHNNRDHRKITVVDGRVAYTGGVNLADEYINAEEKYGHWKDSAVKIEGDAVKNFMALFLTNWNGQNRKALLDCAGYINALPQIAAPDKALLTDSGSESSAASDNSKTTSLIASGMKSHKTNIAIPFGTGPVPFFKEYIGKNVYLNMINAAKKYIYITTPYLVCDHEVLGALRLAAEKGIDVRIITPHIPDKAPVFWMTRSNYGALLDAGVKIYEYTPGFIHAKNLICDDIYGICGTINLDYRSFVHHFECAVWMYDTACIADMKEDFLSTVDQSERIDKNRALLSSWQRLLAQIMKVFSPLL